jgi:uncharacterized 2Fe-2S/4Fe-4S cluster protein (DUF4445 family)
MGACGLCLVRIESGYAGTPTPSELSYLNQGQLAQGIRLACQVFPRHDMEIAILAPAQESCWKTPPDTSVRHIQRQSAPRTGRTHEVKTLYGVAVDLGTTHISLSLYDLSTAQLLAERYGPNPQSRFGADIITRLIAAHESADQARLLGDLVVQALGEGLWDIARREGVDLQQVVQLTLVGNTAMIALLSGRNFDLLLKPSHWTSEIDCLPGRTDAWIAAWGIHPDATVQVIAPLAGFVGSDLLAGLVSTRAANNGGGSLLVDFGTNSEIALWDGRTLWVTSAAGGPAFEGSGISCGLPMGPGAIGQVTAGPDGTFRFSVMDGGKPRGICGSGLVDLIANLVGLGILTSMGKYASSDCPNAFVLVPEERKIVLTQGDVDVFQRAKAAIGAGMDILLAQAGMKPIDLRRIYVGGAFGRCLGVANAQAIGLLPAVEPTVVELCGNTALAGCEELMLSPASGDDLDRLKQRARIVNLSHCPDFEDVYLKHLFLQQVQ